MLQSYTHITLLTLKLSRYTLIVLLNNHNNMQSIIFRDASNDVADSTYCTKCGYNHGNNIGRYNCYNCGKNK